MDETGDQFECQSITNGLKSLGINQSSTEMINELIEDMKDKTCESLVSNDSNTDDAIDFRPNSDPLRRVDDSEAEDIDESVDITSNGQTVETIDETTDDTKDETIDETKDDTNDETIKDESNEKKKESIKVTIVSTESIEEQTPVLPLVGRPNRPLKPRTEKWGESVGIVDERGRVKRVIALKELHNYLILASSGHKTDSKIYCSLINERYPRFFDSTIDCKISLNS